MKPSETASGLTASRMQMMSRHGGANRILRYELLEFLDEAGLGFCWHERSELLHVGPSLSQRDH